MSKYFVALNNGTAAQRNTITHSFAESGWGYWHHFEDVWLLDSPDHSGPSAKDIYERIAGLDVVGDKSSLLVIRIPVSTKINFWGRANPKGWEWMSKHFGSAG